MTMFFYKDLKMNILPDVYEPREDSLLLASIVEKVAKKGDALEIGCGSGLQSIIMAKKGCNVTAVDINPEAVKATKQNTGSNKVGVKCIVSNLFSNVSGRFDLIVFNPPYLREAIMADTRTWAAGENLELISRFVKDCPAHLKTRGTVLVVISSLTGLEKVIEMFKKSHLTAKVVAEQKIPWETLYVIQAEQ